MPDFNTGDFTQQGVNGHVNATVRLNEKRLVNIDMTSNENAEGCTINGTVKDLLNNKVYNIGSAPSGNIAITANTAEGETLNVSQYATATVNVSGGGGEIPTLTITLTPAENATVAELGAISSFNGTLYERVPFASIPTDANSEIIDLYLSDANNNTTCQQGIAFRNNSTGTYSDFVNCTENNERIIITDPTLSSSCTFTFTQIGPK